MSTLKSLKTVEVSKLTKEHWDRLGAWLRGHEPPTSGKELDTLQIEATRHTFRLRSNRPRGLLSLEVIEEAWAFYRQQPMPEVQYDPPASV